MNPNDTHDLVVHGKPVAPGKQLTSFRDEAWTFERISRAPGGPSEGKIIARRNDDGWSQELYPSVFGARLVRRG